VRLKRRGGAQSGVKSDVGGAVGGPGFDVTSAPAFGDGFGAPPGAVTGEFIQRGIQLARGKSFPGFGFLSTIPPVGVLRGKDFLPGGFSPGGLLVIWGALF